ncbi:MAG: hypothetical protein N2510_09990 [Ignavibacteria bacterium]|nr:hypothetical protein [Ignavibacteria bacterium]
MKDGKCVKCGSQVYFKPDGINLGGEGTIYVYTGWITSPSSSIAYVCATCGYFEIYISDQNKLQEVAMKWEKV